MGVMIFRPGQRLVIPGVQVFQPRVTSAAAAGILDGISNVAAAYSLRKLRSAYAGSAVRVRRSSDSTEQDIGFDGTGEFDSGAFSSFVGGGTGFVKTWYDQSVNGRNVSQTTTAAQPTIALSAVNSKPVIRGNGSQFLSPSAWGSSLSQPFLSISCYKWSAGDTYLFGATDLSTRFNTTNASSINANAGAWDSSSAYTQNTYIVSTLVWSGASSPLYRNGAHIKTLSIGTNAANNIMVLGAGPGGAGLSMTGDIAELILMSNNLSAHNTIGTDMATRFGLTWTTVS